MLNRIVLMGRLTRDPEFRRTQSGTSMAHFTLAVDRDYKTQNGDRETDFINCIAWRHSAEFVQQYFTKGRMAVVEGRLQINSWVDQDGENRRSEQVVVSSIYFGDSKPIETSKTADPNNQEWAELDGEEDGDLPF